MDSRSAPVQLEPAKLSRRRCLQAGLLSIGGLGLAELFRLRTLGQVAAAEVVRREVAERVVEQGCRAAHGGIALDRAGRAEAGAGEGVDIRLQRHPVLEADADGGGEIVHQAAEGRAFLQ